LLSFYSFFAFSTSELEFVKPNVIFHDQDQNLPKVINEVSSPSSLSCSLSPQRQARARTVHEKSPSKEVRKKKNEGQDSQLSLKLESVESENEEDGDSDSAAAGQLTIVETFSLPEDFHFIIDEPEDEKVEPVDDGLLPVNCIQLNWLSVETNAD
jgi:hypothetical protein